MQALARKMSDVIEVDWTLGKGSIRSRVMVVTPFLNEYDENRGYPYPDKATVQMIESIGLSMIPDVYYTSAIKEVKGSKKVLKADIDKYLPALKREIELVEPELVILLGGESVKFMFESKRKFTGMVGVPEKVDGTIYLASYAPNLANYDPKYLPYMDQVIDNAQDVLEGNYEYFEKPETNIVLITSREQLKKVKVLPHSSYDIETTGLVRFKDKITLFGWGDDEVQYIIPMDCKFSPLQNKPNLAGKLVKLAIAKLNKSEVISAGNGKFDNLFLFDNYEVSPALNYDVVLASHNYDENLPNGVKPNAKLYCNAHDWDVPLKLKTGNYETKEDYETYVEYLAYDIIYEYMLGEFFEEELPEYDEASDLIFKNISMPAILGFEKLERGGVYVDMKGYRKTKAQLYSDVAKIDKKLSAFSTEVQWGSATQLSEFLYKELGFPVVKKTAKGNASTDSSSLGQLKGAGCEKYKLKKADRFIDLLQARKKNETLISMFMEGWEGFITDGRMYPSFKIETLTGRTQCVKPNLQQVPRDKRIRNMISAPKGWALVESDLSQAELRIASIEANEPAMKEAYMKGEDIHSKTRNDIIGDMASSMSDYESRTGAKAVNFGFIYGMLAPTFLTYARDTYGMAVSPEQADHFRDKFFKVYAGFLPWHERRHREVKRNGYVRSLINRRRNLPHIYSDNFALRSMAERQAVNSPVQSMGSDVTISAMAEIMGTATCYNEDLRVDLTKAIPIGTVHDAILTMVRYDYLEEYCWKAKHIMQRPKVLEEVFNFKSPIPIVADITVGKSWGDGIELDFSKEWKKDIKKWIKETEKNERPKYR